MKISFWKKYRSVILLIAIHALIMLGLLITVIAAGRDIHELFLRDDGYYNITKSFVSGGSLLHRFRGPVLPFILSVLFVFPQSMHPFVRLFISFIFSSGVIIILFRITKKYLSEKQFFIGSLIFVLNPVYIHWTFKSSPDLILAFLLGLFLLWLIDYYRTGKTKYLLYSLLVFSVSFFTKPVFLFIPLFLLLAAFVIKSKKVLIASLVLLVLGIGVHKAQDEFTKIEYDPSASKFERRSNWRHQAFLITDSYWVDYVLKTKQFFKPTLTEYTVLYKDGKSLNEYTHDWIKSFYEKYPHASSVFMSLYFVYDKPLLVLQKLLVSPLFYFSMSARAKETLVKLLFSVFSVFLAILGLKTALKKREQKKDIILIIAALLGFVSLHFVTHAMNRYSLPILPYLYVWGGIPLLRLSNRIYGSMRQRTTTITHDE